MISPYPVRAWLSVGWLALAAACSHAQPISPQNAINIVLVHGAWADGPSWSRVSQIVPDSSGFLKLTPDGITEDFAPDLSQIEEQELTVTQEPWSCLAFSTAVSAPAWKSKSTWFVIAANDRVVSPVLEATEALNMHATTALSQRRRIAWPRKAPGRLGSIYKRLGGGAPSRQTAGARGVERAETVPCHASPTATACSSAEASRREGKRDV